LAKYAILQSFYASEKWINFRLNIISQRGLRCEYCKQPVTKLSELTLHHKKELTPENVNDNMIALNPDNVMVVHHDCHNKIHGRFGYFKPPEHDVYIVYGAPMSGKTTYVKENMKRGDLVVDMDRLYEAVSFLPSYDKPDNLFKNVACIQNALLDNIKTRYGKWDNAWVIGGYADKNKRERLAKDLGAKLIFCNVSKEVCIKRLEYDVDRRYRIDEWTEYIEKWFQNYMG
jgi:predicted kinase